MADHTKDRDYNYKDFDDVFDKMREEGFVDGIEDTFKDDEDAIITDIGDFEQELKDDIPNESKVFHMKGDHKCGNMSRMHSGISTFMSSLVHTWLLCYFWQPGTFSAILSLINGGPRVMHILSSTLFI